MNMNRIINMIINQVIRYGIRGVMKGGMNIFTKSRKDPAERTEQDEQQINMSKEDRQKMNAVRRNRF